MTESFKKGDNGFHKLLSCKKTEHITNDFDWGRRRRRRGLLFCFGPRKEKRGEEKQRDFQLSRQINKNKKPMKMHRASSDAVTLVEY